MIASPAHAAFVSVSVYDLASDANDVDQEAAFVSATGTGSAANLLSLSDFRMALTPAFAAGLGGVVDFESGNLENQAGDSDNDGGQFIRTTLGSRGYVFSSNNGGDDFDYPGATSGNRTATSGTVTLGKDSGNVDFNFNIGPITGGMPNEAITSFGITVIDRSGSGTATYTGTANFSGGGSVTSQFLLSNDGNSDEDTFFGYIAPTGQSITSVYIDGSNSGLFTTVDDLGYIATAIPEPSTTALFAILIPLLARRRR